jgi:methylated-DNA-[protein]-cysteine S-methyltransferase
MQHELTGNLWLAVLPSTPIGLVSVAVSEIGVARIHIGAAQEGTQPAGSAPPSLRAALEQLQEYFAGQRRAFDLPIDWTGTPPFAARARRACLEIPYGQVTTYARLAESIGSPRASRAVGGAMAANPLPILIPCHRVVGSDGRLHGYAAPDGIRTKKVLLELEGVKGYER